MRNAIWHESLKAPVARRIPRLTCLPILHLRVLVTGVLKAPPTVTNLNVQKKRDV